MPHDDAECCGRCQYWIKVVRPDYPTLDTGSCHYNPPQPGYTFPQIASTGWCGKWEPRLRNVIANVDPS